MYLITWVTTQIFALLMLSLMICQSLTKRDKVVSLMFRDKTLDEVLSYKFLLLGIVRLIHADPNLMLNVCDYCYQSR